MTARMTLNQIMSTGSGASLRDRAAAASAVEPASRLQHSQHPLRWQPIETAPRDGSPILVCVADKPHDNCCYHPDKAWWSSGPPSGWVIALTDAGKRIGLTIVPTHWMYLPAPPAAL